MPCHFTQLQLEPDAVERLCSLPRQSDEQLDLLHRKRAAAEAEHTIADNAAATPATVRAAPRPLRPLADATKAVFGRLRGSSADGRLRAGLRLAQLGAQTLAGLDVAGSAIAGGDLDVEWLHQNRT